MSLQNEPSDYGEPLDQPPSESAYIEPHAEPHINPNEMTIRFELPTERHEGPQFARLRRAPSPYPFPTPKPKSRLSKAFKTMKRYFTMSRCPIRHQNPVKTSRILRNYPEYKIGGSGLRMETKTSRAKYAVWPAERPRYTLVDFLWLRISSLIIFLRSKIIIAAMGRFNLWDMSCMLFELEIKQLAFDAFIQKSPSLVAHMLEIIEEALPHHWQEAWRPMSLEQADQDRWRNKYSLSAEEERIRLEDRLQEMYFETDRNVLAQEGNSSGWSVARENVAFGACSEGFRAGSFAGPLALSR
ncbi:hypothetical protein OPT61_g3407 [Boeremia exigua]|uniref:Uncharacterized protein n=1 Tax=Boeremia exigua TaxID=749465 RepID=A0ACC2IHY5_9PLEO|nr:hypothetical protein OPT61_g3407 [Boeremia exigua]